MTNHTKSCDTMNTKFEETVFDFDLNFLQQSSVNAVIDNKIEKQQKALLIAKKKTIATDSLIRKYYAKQEQLEQNESILNTAKEECKQVCLDYKKSLEKCSILEKEAEQFKTRNKDLESKFLLAQNQCDALKSHTHQLQLLIKDHEKKIEALNVKKQCSKTEGNSTNKSILQKQNDIFLSDIYLLKDIVLGKAKLGKKHKLILQKYEKKKNKKSVDEECNIVDEDSLITPSELSLDSPENKNKNLQAEILLPNILEKEKTFEVQNFRNGCKDLKEVSIFDEESDYSNEFISEDTGCGSSITFSDGEKCFNSPDYFINDSPLETEHIKRKNNTLVNTATSPHRFCERNEIATSPLAFDNESLLSDTTGISYNHTDINNAEYFITDIPLSTEIVTIKEKRKLLDVGTSPIRDVERVNTATSPIVFIENIVSNNAIAIDSTNITENDADTYNEINEPINTNVITPALSSKLPTLSDLSSNHELEICEKSVLEKRCLDRHNSKNVLQDNNIDEEIEMILNTMRFSHKILTPIPETPSISRRKASSDNIVMPEVHYVCPDAIKMSQDNKILHSSIANLSNEILSIKSLLQNHMFLRQVPREQLTTKCNNKFNGDLCENTSQENLIINNNVSNKVSLCENIIEHSDSIDTTELENTEPPETEEQCAQDETVESQWNLDLTGNEDDSCDNNVREAATLIEKDGLSEVNSDRIIFEKEPNIEIEDKPTEYRQNNFCKKNNGKRKVISKLDKLKHKCLPKYKIAKASSSPNKSRRPKPKPLSTLRCNNKTDPFVLLNNKSAYEKAIKVMSEIKSKEKKKRSYFKSGSFSKPVTQESHPQKETANINITNIESTTFKNTNLSPTMPLDVVMNNKKSINVDKEKRNNNSINKKDMLFLPSTHSESIHMSNTITTRSRSKRIESHECEKTKRKVSESNDFNHKSIEKRNDCTSISLKPQDCRKQLKRGASISPEIKCKRVLRSSNVKEMCKNYSNIQQQLQRVDTITTNINSTKSIPNSPKSVPELKVVINANELSEQLLHNRQIVKYIDFDANIRDIADSNLVAQEPEKTENLIGKNHTKRQNEDLLEPNTHINKPKTDSGSSKENLNNYPRDSILCHMIVKYGKKTIRHTATKVSDKITISICKKLEDDIAHIIQLQTDKSKTAMNKLVEDIKKMNFKSFMTGFMMYLKDPARKRELFNKVNSLLAPAMTKSEQILLYVIKQLNTRSLEAVNTILTNIEFSLFQLNRGPDVNVAESMSHLYALICRYFGLKHRLRLFILDAMYCLQYKVIPIIKQCLDVWMHILPLAHMGIAKSPLVTCIVYLLHFYKCQDRGKIVQDIRFILSKKYFYQISDWNESKILEMFKNAIKEVKEVTLENKILRTALIILAKRLGAKWCHKNVIKNMLLPMIEGDISEKSKRFCVTMLGPLMKPFPADMKVHCEIMVNQLLDMLQQNPSEKMKEAIFTSLIYMNKHNQFRVTQTLLAWEPKNVSREFEDLLRDFVREKPVKAWLKILPRMV